MSATAPTDPPQSGPPYIIICSGRGRLAVAKNYSEKVNAAMTCASELAFYMGLRYRTSLDPVDISRLAYAQHELMDLAQEKADVDAKITELFVIMDALERKYIGASY